MFLGGFGRNGGSGSANIGRGLSGLGMSTDNIFGSNVRVRGSYDTDSLISGYSPINTGNIGTILMLEQIEQMGNRNNNYNYNNGYNNQQNYPQNNGFSNQNNGYNNQQNYLQNNGFSNQNNGYNNQQNYPQNNGFSNQNNGYNNQQNYPQNNGFSNQNNGYNNQQNYPQNNGFCNQNNGYNNQQNYPQNNGFSNQNNGYNQSSGFVSSNSQPNRINVAQSQPNVQPVAQPQTSSLKPPKRRRPGIANPGAPLMRGQKYAISGSGKLKIGLGWDIEDSRCELDASAFMIGANGKIVGDEWFIFYGQDTSPDKSVKYKVFDINQSTEDDAEVSIDLNAVDLRVEKIIFAITMYEASARRINFGMVKNVYARIMDGTNDKETARFQLTECYDNVTALVVGELYRYKGTWKFNAVGSGVAKDLAEFCGMYGVVLC